MQEAEKNNAEKLSKTIGRIIEKHRITQGKTAYSISAECGMRKSTWRYAELGIDLRLSTLWKISEGLNIDISALLQEVKQELGADFSLIDDD